MHHHQSESETGPSRPPYFDAQSSQRLRPASKAKTYSTAYPDPMNPFASQPPLPSYSEQTQPYPPMYPPPHYQAYHAPPPRPSARAPRYPPFHQQSPWGPPTPAQPYGYAPSRAASSQPMHDHLYYYHFREAPSASQLSPTASRPDPWRSVPPAARKPTPTMLDLDFLLGGAAKAAKSRSEKEKEPQPVAQAIEEPPVAAAAPPLPPPTPVQEQEQDNDGWQDESDPVVMVEEKEVEQRFDPLARADSPAVEQQPRDSTEPRTQGRTSTSATPKEPIRLHGWRIQVVHIAPFPRNIIDSLPPQQKLLRKRAKKLEHWIIVYGLRSKDEAAHEEDDEDEDDRWHSSPITDLADPPVTPDGAVRVKTNSGSVYELVGPQDKRMTREALASEWKRWRRRQAATRSEEEDEQGLPEEPPRLKAIEKGFREGWMERIARGLLNWQAGISDAPASAKDKIAEPNKAEVSFQDDSVEEPQDMESSFESYAGETRASNERKRGRQSKENAEKRIKVQIELTQQIQKELGQPRNKTRLVKEEAEEWNSLANELFPEDAQVAGSEGLVKDEGEKSVFFFEDVQGVPLETEMQQPEEDQGDQQGPSRTPSRVYRLVEHSDVPSYEERLPHFAPSQQVNGEMSSKTMAKATAPAPSPTLKPQPKPRGRPRKRPLSPKPPALPLAPASDKRTAVVAIPAKARVKKEVSSGNMIGAQGKKIPRELLRLMRSPFGLNPAAKRGYIEGCSPKNPIVIEQPDENKGSSTAPGSSETDAEEAAATDYDDLPGSPLVERQESSDGRHAIAKNQNKWWEVTPVTCSLTSYRKAQKDRERDRLLRRAQRNTRKAVTKTGVRHSTAAEDDASDADEYVDSTSASEEKENAIQKRPKHTAVKSTARKLWKEQTKRIRLEHKQQTKVNVPRARKPQPVQLDANGEVMKKRRGRPPGSGKRQLEMLAAAQLAAIEAGTAAPTTTRRAAVEEDQWQDEEEEEEEDDGADLFAKFQTITGRETLEVSASLTGFGVVGDDYYFSD